MNKFHVSYFYGCNELTWGIAAREITVAWAIPTSAELAEIHDVLLSQLRKTTPRAKSLVIISWQPIATKEAA